MAGQIIALGGGGFSEGSEPELDHYVLEQSPAPQPRIGFIPTASGDADSYVFRFYARFAALNCRPSHLPLFRRTPDLEEWVNAQDVIFVGGGNTKSRLAVWRVWGLPEVLSNARNHGTVLAGISAGAICWFEYGVTDSAAQSLGPLECLGFLPGSCCPHYSMEKARKPTYEHLVGSGAIPGGVAVDDGAAVHFRDGAPYRTIVGRRGAGAYQVRRTAGGVALGAIPGVETVRCAIDE